MGEIFLAVKPGPWVLGPGGKLNEGASPPLPAHTATPRTDAAMAQQQTYDVWHGARFLKFGGRRVVSAVIVAAR